MQQWLRSNEVSPAATYSWPTRMTAQRYKKDDVSNNVTAVSDDNAFHLYQDSKGNKRFRPKQCYALNTTCGRAKI